MKLNCQQKQFVSNLYCYNIIWIKITLFTFGDEEEVLLSMHSIFRIVQVNKILLTLTDDGDDNSNLTRITQSIRCEIEGDIGWYRLGLYTNQNWKFRQSRKCLSNIDQWNTWTVQHSTCTCDSSTNIDIGNYSQLAVTYDNIPIQSTLIHRCIHLAFMISAFVFDCIFVVWGISKINYTHKTLFSQYKNFKFQSVDKKTIIGSIFSNPFVLYSSKSSLFLIEYQFPKYNYKRQ